MSINIKNQKIEDAEKILINKTQWGYDEYIPEVYVQIVYDETGFNVKFTVMEDNPKREKTKHFEFVHEDSCVEFFVNFNPEKSDKYINFETNANGVMNVGFRSDRYNSIPLKLEEIENFGIKAYVHDDYWTVSYKIDMDFIKRYYPDFELENTEYISGNIYKCGDKTEVMHFLACFDLKCEKPDFHRPEYFGKIYLD